jgi:hypothetical protein
LSGLFDLGGSHDVAMIEELVYFDSVFDGFSYRGVTDIRIILYKGYPVMASRYYEVTERGYLGADIVLDALKGPLILEFNARPGLAIQMANGVGMRTRFAAVEPEISKNRNPEDRVAFSQETFSLH